MIRHLYFLLFIFLPIFAAAQSSDPAANVPMANPGRPTVSTPATLTPTGYAQFESGLMYARHSPEFSSQENLSEVVKFTVLPRLELLVGSEPFAHSLLNGSTSNEPGGISLGAQGILHAGEGARPTVALGYSHQVYGGNAPDLDIGSPENSVLLLVSADVKGFHYDTNFIVNEMEQSSVRREQLGQTLSISHPLIKKVGLSGELWHFTQPFLRGHAVGNLWALNYNVRNTLVLDGGFNRGLTGTSTRWEVFTGFTYLLPHKLLR